MAKPIFIVGFPPNADPESIGQVYKDLDHKLGEEYHVLTYRAQGLTDIDFKVLNVADAEDAQLAEIITKTREDIELLLKERPLVDLSGIADEIIKKNKEQNGNS
jgi:hypothetical protein